MMPSYLTNWGTYMVIGVTLAGSDNRMPFSAKNLEGPCGLLDWIGPKAMSPLVWVKIVMLGGLAGWELKIVDHDGDLREL